MSIFLRRKGVWMSYIPGSVSMNNFNPTYNEDLFLQATAPNWSLSCVGGKVALAHLPVSIWYCRRFCAWRNIFQKLCRLKEWSDDEGTVMPILKTVVSWVKIIPSGITDLYSLRMVVTPRPAPIMLEITVSSLRSLAFYPLFSRRDALHLEGDIRCELSQHDSKGDK